MQNYYLDHPGLVLVFLVQKLNKVPKIVEFLEFRSDYFTVGYRCLFHLSFRVSKKRRSYQILSIQRANNEFDNERVCYLMS